MAGLSKADLPGVALSAQLLVQFGQLECVSCYVSVLQSQRPVVRASRTQIVMQMWPCDHLLLYQLLGCNIGIFKSQCCLFPTFFCVLSPYKRRNPPRPPLPKCKFVSLLLCFKCRVFLRWSSLFRLVVFPVPCANSGRCPWTCSTCQALSSSMALSSFMFKPAGIHPDHWGAKACHAKQPRISLTRLESCMWQLRLVKSLLVLSASEASYQRLAASSLLPKPLSHMLRTPRGFGGYGCDVRCVLSCKVSTGPTRSFGCRKKEQSAWILHASLALTFASLSGTVNLMRRPTLILRRCILLLSFVLRSKSSRCISSCRVSFCVSVALLQNPWTDVCYLLDLLAKFL